MNNPIVTTSSSSIVEHSIIGDTPMRIPTVGRIRSGIMVLKKALQSSKKLVQIYQAGVTNQLSWQEIGSQLKKATGKDERMLVPKNVDYFTVRGNDFVDPGMAKNILSMYGEDRGQGIKLYKIPVIFPVDQWLSVIPHNLTHYTFSKRVHWSEYDRVGTRWCKQYVAAEIDERTKKAKRTFGGRKTMLRPENDGICDPDKCPEYQENKCSLSGRYIFYVPGTKGIGAVEIPTGSFYSMEQARSILGMVARIRNGKISGLHNGEPIFYLTKKQEEVSMIDDKGEPKRVKQWLITLETNIEIQSVFTQMEALQDDSPAPNLLESDIEEEFDVPEETTPDIETAPATTGHDLVKELRANLSAGLKALGIKPEDFNAYGLQELGDGWARKEDTLKYVNTLLGSAADDPVVLDQLKMNIFKLVNPPPEGV